MEVTPHTRTQDVSMGNESLLEVEGTRVAQRSITCAQEQNDPCAGTAHLTRGGSLRWKAACAQKDARCLLSMPGPGTYMTLGVPVTTPDYHVCC